MFTLYDVRGVETVFHLHEQTTQITHTVYEKYTINPLSSIIIRISKYLLLTCLEQCQINGWRFNSKLLQCRSSQ